MVPALPLLLGNNQWIFKDYSRGQWFLQLTGQVYKTALYLWKRKQNNQTYE